MSVITRSGLSALDERDRRTPATLARGGTATAGQRGMSPALIQRVALLPTRDRAIIELTLRANLSRSGIARALGTSAGQVSRRLRILYARLHDPLVLALLDPQCLLPPEHRQLGIEHALLGITVPQLAQKHDLTPGEVRKMIAYLRGWQKGIAGRR